MSEEHGWMEGVREYGEDGTPALSHLEHDPNSCSKVPEGGRWVVIAWNEGGYNLTQVDLLDLLKWLRAHRPDLLELKEEK